MGKRALCFVMALFLLRAVAPATAQQTSPAAPGAAGENARAADGAPGKPASTETRNRVFGYTAWDDDFFYIALQVNKPLIAGTNSEPFSDPLADDAAIISIQTDGNQTSTKRTAHTVVVAVSAAGGAQLYSGADGTPLFNGLKDLTSRLEDIGKNEKDPVAQEQKRAALLAKVIKFQVSAHGAPRIGAGPAPGYTLEVAIPWADLGRKPESGTKWGFNVAAQSKVQGSPPLQSLSPRVKSSADLDDPSQWSQIEFRNAPTRSTPDLLVCPRVFAGKPVIDGELNSGEWNGLSSFEFGESAESGSGSPERTSSARVRPEFKPQPPRPRVPLTTAGAEPAQVAAHRPQKVAPLVLARFEYWFQADPRKAAPAEHVMRADGSTALINHPLEGMGPWFSYDCADWHRRQLQDVRQAGIDVILPVYRGGARERQLYADKGLTVMATALQSLRRAGQDYPQVAMYLETGDLAEMLGGPPDLREPATQAALYSIIRDFYRHIPAEFRYVVPLLNGASAGRAYPVFLSDAGAFQDWDSAFVSYLRGRFAADFEGADLIVIGASDFKPKATLDGYFTETRDKGFQYDGDGWIKIASIGPGYDNSLTLTSSTDTPLYRSRRDGDTYRNDWNAALARHPDWVLIGGWNDYSVGAEVAPTLETGFSAADLTKVYTRRFAGMARTGVKILWHDVPATMLSGATCSVHIRAQNTGTEAWSPGAAGPLAVALAYRWLRNGQAVTAVRTTPLNSLVLAGDNINMSLPISVSGDRGALADGDYTLEISPVEVGKKDAIETWLGDSPGSQRLLVPVQVRGEAARTWAATLINTDLPTMLENGSVYDVHATLRNDGAKPWRKADGARITLRLYRTTPVVNARGVFTGALTETPVATADATAQLTQDVAPGQETTVRLLAPVTDPEGKPLPAWSQDDLWTYTARWEVAAGESKRGAADGIAISPTPIAVVPFDFGVRFTADGTPSALPGERRLPVSLSLQNVGPQTWKKESVRVGYHWYYQDGTEFLFEDETTAIPQDVPPGGHVNELLAWVTAPPCDGTYYLEWDVKFGDTWASTAAGTRVFDRTVHAVQVLGGRLTFADLTKAYNLDGVTDTEHLTDGDFDGQGRTFPAVLIPPFANAAVVPSAMWLPAAATGPESPRRISFRWGPKDLKEKNFIVCKGQRLELGKSAGQCRVLHIIAASTGQDIQTELRLIFQEPTSQSEDLLSFSVSRWDRPPTHNEELAYLFRDHHDRRGVQPGAVALYHYAITVHEPRKLVALVLPNAPRPKDAIIPPTHSLRF